MKRIIYTLLFLSIFSNCGKEKINDNDINTTKTKRHINIPGTRVFIIPPSGFKIATSFTGLQKGDSAAIEVLEINGGNFYTNAATFSKETFEQKGIKVYDYKEFKINGYPAKYAEIQGSINKKGIGLIFGDTTFATMIMVQYPSEDTKTEEQVKKSLKTIYYDKNLKIDPLQTAPFTLDDSKSIFKFSTFSAGLYVYTLGGNPENEEPFIIVFSTPRDTNINEQNISLMMLASVEKYGFILKKFKNISTLIVNGQHAYEAEVSGKMKGKDALIYQLIVMGQDKAIIFEGYITSDFANNLREIKKLAKTIKLR